MKSALMGNRTILESLRDMVTLGDPGLSVGLIRYHQLNNNSSIFFPLLEDINVEERFGNYDETFATAFIPNQMIVPTTHISIDVDSVLLVCHQKNIRPEILLSALYKDTFQKFKAAEHKMEENELKLGYVAPNNILQTPDTNQSPDYYLKHIRCTEVKVIFTYCL